MRLTVTVKTEHSEIVSSVAWTPDNQLFSCSDDKSICRWNSNGTTAGKIPATNLYVSNISWFPSVGKQTADMFAVSCTDGTFRFLSRSGREEKKVAAHEGAVILVTWSHDGSTLLSAGEDGDIKIWSKNGNLRSTLASTGQSVYCACWGPDDDQVVIASGNSLMIKSVQASKKNVQWVAHGGVILCVDWNITNQNIVSGGEDCLYRVWDSFGHMLYSSKVMENVITSIQWCPNGEIFAVGSFNIIKLCDKAGWTHSKERLQTGSIMNIAWTSDGTQFAGSCGNGSVVFAQVVDRRLEWKTNEVILVEPRKIRVQDVANETQEDIEYPRDRVVEIGLGFDWLVVTTSTQCYIYSIQNLNTPVIFDIRSPPHFLHMCRKCFLTLDLISGVQIISYEGRVTSSLRFQGLRPEYITKDMVCLSPDIAAIIDNVDKKIIHIFDSITGKYLAKIQHSAEISSVCINQHTLGVQDRILAFSDRNKDLLVGNLSVLSSPTVANNNIFIPTAKVSSSIDSFSFNDETDVLVGISSGEIYVWYCPMVMFVDRDILKLTTSKLEAPEFGRNAQILSYTGSRITVRKVDGSLLFAATSSDFDLLYELMRAQRWDQSIRLCRHQKNSALWASLGVVSLSKKQLDTVEICMSELNEVVKAEYIQYIKSIPSEEGKQAELALYKRQPNEAERILLQASPPLVYRAIMMNINSYRWSRALDIAVKYRSHVDTTLAYRMKFLEEFGKKETDNKFLQLASQVNVDWDAIVAKQEKELADEMAFSEGRGGVRK